MTPIDAAKADFGRESLRELAVEAEDFLRSQPWCIRIEEGFIERGWAGVLAVIFFRITASKGAPSEMWVIVGDIPPAYFGPKFCPTGTDALCSYVSRMRDWVNAVKRGRSSDELIPVLTRYSLEPVRPTRDMARELEHRLGFIDRKKIARRWVDT